MDDDMNMDALFGSFMNEVTNIKSTKMKKMEASVGTAEDIVERLSTMKYDPKQGVGSAFQVLQMSPEASETDISKQYKRLSVLIHPDKCKLEAASEAFQLLVRAYNDTKDPNYSDKYKDIVGLAKQRVRKQREADNAVRSKKGEDPLDMQGNEFDQEVLKECERMTTCSTEHAEYKNSVLEANLKRQAEGFKEAKMRRKEEEASKKQFERNRDKRAAGWQTFVNNVETKRFKSGHIVGMVGGGNAHHKREERTELQGKGEADVDREDKKIIRSDTQAGQAGIDRKYRQQWR